MHDSARRVLPALVLLLVAQTSPARAASEQRVVLIIVDGVRSLELAGRAKDVHGRRLPARSLFPNLLGRMASRGRLYRKVEVSNKVGISLPAYAEILTGSSQPGVTTNDRRIGKWSEVPSLAEHLVESGGLQPQEAVVLAAWAPVCDVAVSGPRGAAARRPVLRCGPQAGDVRRSPFADSRSDQDTFLDAVQVLRREQPRFLAVVFGEADEEGHLVEAAAERYPEARYSTYHYHEAIRRADHYIGQIWDLLEADATYRGRTTLIVTTDHGRDSDVDPEQWSSHGRCVRQRQARELCQGCRRVFLFTSYPPRSSQQRLVAVSTRLDHLDIAPAVVALLGAPRAPWMRQSALLRPAGGQQR